MIDINQVRMSNRYYKKMSEGKHAKCDKDEYMAAWAYDGIIQLVQSLLNEIQMPRSKVSI